ncbi:MAG: YbaN family protein [Dehalococcoidia bacterium]|nr:YbaN family protein [Dehalococcoidia bacterium]
MPDRLKRWLFIAAGTVCVCIGAVGIVVPGLPTTPFLLLAAFCYTRGSQRLYTALLNNRLVGSYLRNYLEGRGMTRRSKVWTLSLLWGGIILAAVLATDSMSVRILLAIILCGVTAHILTVGTVRTDARVPTTSHPDN